MSSAFRRSVSVSTVGELGLSLSSPKLRAQYIRLEVKLVAALSRKGIAPLPVVPVGPPAIASDHLSLA